VNSSKAIFSWKNLRYYTLIYFILAGLTGVLYRLSMVGWSPWELNLDFIRHAHSHLMFFGWAAPAPMIYIGQQLQYYTQKSQFGARLAIGLMLVLGLCSYPFFLFYGYRPVPLGSTQLPLAAIFSGLVMLAWYLFMGIYVRHRKRLFDNLSTYCFDIALFLLFLGSLGAWGVSVVQFLDVNNPFWGKGLTHLFLTAFTEGWVVISILGIFYAEYETQATSNQSSLLLLPLLVGVPLLFPFGMSVSLLTDSLLLAARVGGFIVGLTLLYHLFVIWKTTEPKKGARYLWIFPIILLFAKILMQLGASILPSNLWMGQHGLNILYLHVTLLGFATPALLNSYRVSIPYEGWRKGVIETSIALLLLTLIPFTPAWPVALSGSWIFHAMAIGALLPPVSMSLLFMKR